MPSKKILEQLIELAKTANERAARALGASRNRAQEEQGRLQLLLDYRREYIDRFAAAARAGLDRAAWANYHQFMAKLDAAILQQGELAAQHRESVDQRRRDWHSTNTKLKSFDTLDRRRQDAERSNERRREQREQDEFAGRKRPTDRS